MLKQKPAVPVIEITQSEEKETTPKNNEKRFFFQKWKFELALVFLYLLDFHVKIIVFFIDEQIMKVVNDYRAHDYIPFPLEPFKIVIFALSIVGVIIAGVVDHFNFIFNANLVGLAILFGDVAVVGFTIAPFVHTSLEIHTKVLFLAHTLSLSNIIFEPIRTVLILKHFDLPDNLKRLMLWIGVLMILRNLAVIIATLLVAVESLWVRFYFNIYALVLLLTFMVLLVYFKREFSSSSPIPFLQVIKCYLYAIKLKFKKKNKQMIVMQQYWTDRVLTQPEEIRESTRLMASIMFILSTFLIMGVLVKLINDAYDYQVEIKTDLDWIGRLRAEQIVAGMNIINLIFLISLGILIPMLKRVKGFLNDLRRIVAAFIFILIAACIYIYAQNDLDTQPVILPNFRNAKIRLYNSMNSSVMISSLWTGEITLSAYGSRSFFVAGKGILHTLMTVTNHEEGFEMRMIKTMTKENVKTTYTKTIFAREFETTSYVISNLGLVKTASIGKDEEPNFLKNMSVKVARVLILSSISWYYNPPVLYIKGGTVDLSMKLPEPDGNKLIGFHKATYDYHILNNNIEVSIPNSTLDFNSWNSYGILCHERLDEDKIRIIKYFNKEPILKNSEATPIALVGLYFLSLGLSIIQIWLTRFIYAESPVPTRCFLFAFLSLMWITGSSIYYLVLFIWPLAMFIMVIGVVIFLYILDLLWLSVWTQYFNGQSWNLEAKTN